MAFDLLQSIENDTNKDKQRCTSKELREFSTDSDDLSKSRHNSDNR